MNLHRKNPISFGQSNPEFSAEEHERSRKAIRGLEQLTTLAQLPEHKRFMTPGVQKFVGELTVSLAQSLPQEASVEAQVSVTVLTPEVQLAYSPGI